VYTPPDLGLTTEYHYYDESFGCCWISYNKTFGGACDAGHVYGGVTVEHFENHAFLGGCDVVQEGSGSDCSVTVHFYNKGTNGANCRIHINETRTCF
jgi:hypothetical protein